MGSATLADREGWVCWRARLLLPTQLCFSPFTERSIFLHLARRFWNHTWTTETRVERGR
jgi:hypothetical protein